MLPVANPTDADAQQLARLTTFLEHDPTNPRLLAELTDAHLAAGRWVEARRLLSATLAAHPADSLARYRLAVVERATGHPAEAAALLLGLRAEGVDDNAVLIELASAQAAMAQWSAVVETLAGIDAPMLPPALGDEVWLLRLRARHHLQQWPEALEDAQAWIAARGQRLPADAAGALGTLFLDAGRFDMLEELLMLSERTATEQPELLAAEGYLRLSQGKTGEAQRAFGRSVALAPTSGRACLGLGLAAAMQGQTDEALEALTRATQAMPQHLGSWHALAWIHLLRRDLTAAEHQFQMALDADRTFGDSHGGLALVAALRRDQARASELLRVARKLDPESMNARIARMVLERDTDLSDTELIRQALQQVLRIPAVADAGAAALLQELAARLDHPH